MNAVSAGPLSTVAAKSIPGFRSLEKAWLERSPIEWDSTDPAPVAQMVALLLSDWTPMTTGEVVHVDGGFHSLAAASRE